jgi:hypothetical protein
MSPNFSSQPSNLATSAGVSQAMTAIKALILATAATAVFAGPAAAASDGTSNTIMVAEAHAPKPPQGIIAILIGL